MSSVWQLTYEKLDGSDAVIVFPDRASALRHMSRAMIDVKVRHNRPIILAEFDEKTNELLDEEHYTIK